MLVEMIILMWSCQLITNYSFLINNYRYDR